MATFAPIDLDLLASSSPIKATPHRLDVFGPDKGYEMLQAFSSPISGPASAAHYQPLVNSDQMFGMYARSFRPIAPKLPPQETPTTRATTLPSSPPAFVPGHQSIRREPQPQQEEPISQVTASQPQLTSLPRPVSAAPIYIDSDDEFTEEFPDHFVPTVHPITSTAFMVNHRSQSEYRYSLYNIAESSERPVLYSPYCITYLQTVLRNERDSKQRAVKFLEVLTGQGVPIKNEWWSTRLGLRIRAVVANWLGRIEWRKIVFEDGVVVTVVKL
jgi:hypothetical protein